MRGIVRILDKASKWFSGGWGDDDDDYPRPYQGKNRYLHKRGDRIPHKRKPKLVYFDVPDYC